MKSGLQPIIPKQCWLDGMNVSILAKRQIADKLIVPKTAVLPRTKGRKCRVCLQDGMAGYMENMSKQDLKIAGKCVSNRD